MTKKTLTRRPARPLSKIAEEIISEINSGAWSKHSAFHAAPYLVAMREIETIKDKYYEDSGRSIVIYFLSNAQTWRGETAARIKLELRGMLS